MGCSSSKPFQINTIFPGQDANAVRDMQLLELDTKDIEKLYHVFCKFDIVGDGKIELVEFCVKLEIENDKIAKEIFSDMDRNGDGELNFREFVLCVWRYLVRTRESVAYFAFDMFDTGHK